MSGRDGSSAGGGIWPLRMPEVPITQMRRVP